MGAQHDDFQLLYFIDQRLEDVPVGASRYLIFLACLSVMTLDGLDFQLLAFAAPLLLEELAISKTALGAALGMGLVGMALGAPLGGWMGDRWGPGRSLGIAALVFGAATLGLAATGHIREIIGLRLISGFGFGAAIPNGMALAGGWSGPGRRGTWIAILSLGTPIGAVLGGILSAWLVPLYGWRMPFLICGALTLGLAVAVWRLLPEPPAFLLLKKGEKQARELLSRVLGTASHSEEPLRVSPAAETGAPTPLLSRPTLRTNLTLWISFFGLACAAYAYFNWFPTIFTEAGFPLVKAIEYTSIFSFVSIGGSLFTTAIARHVNARCVLVPLLAGALAGTCLLAITLLSFGGHYVVLLMGVAGFCVGAAQTGLYVLASSSYPASQRARAIGICVGFSRVGGICIVFGGGVFLSTGPSGTGSFFAAMALMLALTIGAMLFFRRPAHR